MPSLLERFDSKVLRLGDDACWDWSGAKDQHGYGRLGLVTPKGKRAIPASRIAWMLFRGPIPESLCVLHRCDNPPCTNPKHLFLGTYKDNSLDMVIKGRCKAGWQNAIKRLCKRDHPLSGRNLIVDADGLRHCRECAKSMRRIWRNRNRLACNSKCRQWYENNREKVLAKKKAQYQFKKEK